MNHAAKPRLVKPDASRKAVILQVLPSLDEGGGGVERGTVEIAAAIVAAGGQALVASSGGGMVNDILRVRARHFALPVDSKNPLTMAANIQRLEKLIRSESVDIVHVRSRAPAWSAFFAARRAGIHFMTTFHGPYSQGNGLKRFYNSIMTRGERVIAISNFIAGHVHQVYGIPASTIRIIHRGVDVKHFSRQAVSADRVAVLASQWRLDGGLPVIMLPGRLTRWKGQLVFIRAIASLKRRDFRCLLVGSSQGRDAYRQELEDAINENGLNEIVRIVDYCADMPAAYMLTDVVVSASTDPEAFGRVAAEAQAMGRPVIATDHGGAREIVIAGETGWLTPPGGVNALAMAIDQALDLEISARARLADKASANVCKHFSKDEMCARTIAVYNELLNAPLQRR